MSHAIWNGSISFGLVTIPVKLIAAVRADEEIHFHFLHARDKGRIKNLRKCEVCGKEVPWSETVRGYERRAGSFVTVTDDELKALRPEANQSVEIRAFVDRADIDPMLFDTPYYLEPEKKGRRAYALLRDALVRAGKVGIAQVVLRTRSRLAALSPDGDGLIVEILRYPHEIVAAKEIDLPSSKERATAQELKAAETLIAAMVGPFKPADYDDEYEDRLRAMLEARGHGKGPARANGKRRVEASNVVDLAALLDRSLAKTAKIARATSKPSRARRATAHAR